MSVRSLVSSLAHESMPLQLQIEEGYYDDYMTENKKAEKVVSKDEKQTLEPTSEVSNFCPVTVIGSHVVHPPSCA